MIVYDMVMNVLDTKWFPQHNIADLISGIIFVLFQSGEASTVEGIKHTNGSSKSFVSLLKETISYFGIVIFWSGGKTVSLEMKNESYFQNHDTLIQINDQWSRFNNDLRLK